MTKLQDRARRKQLKGLTTHKTAQEAYEATTKPGIIAVCVKTYQLDSLAEKEFYTYKSKYEDMTHEELYEDFPLSLGSNQSIEEIDQFD